MGRDVEEMRRRALLLLDMIDDWVHHTSEPHFRIEGLTDGGDENGGEEWRDQDFDEVTTLLRDLVGRF